MSGLTNIDRMVRPPESTGFAMSLPGFLRIRLHPVDPLERQQAYVRIIVVAALSIYFLWSHFFRHARIAPDVFVSLVLGIAYCAGTLIVPYFGLGNPFHRRIVCLLMDTAFVCHTMHLGDRSCAPMVLILLLQNIGYPTRYGKKFLPYGIIASGISFSLVLLTTPYWRQNIEMGCALLVGFTAIPVFHVSNVVKKIREAKEKAEIASRTKSRFLSNMSHEMRTPLNGILGTADLLNDTQMDPEQQQYLKTVRMSAMHLLALINDVLDISKIEEGKVSITPEDMDLHALVRNTASIVAQQITSKGLDFRVFVSPEVPFLLKGDTTRLRQILANLLSNAIKFTAKGAIALRVLKEDEDERRATVRFEVSDTGIGLTNDEQAKIFERFTQADGSITRKYGGTGLGTAISKELIELMGGRIGVRSRKGDGSTFWFTVPLEKQPDGSITAAMAKPFARTKVLVVSADDKITEAINGYLASLKVAHVKHARNAGQAYHYADRAVKDRSFRHVAIVVRDGLGEDPFRFADTLDGMGLRRNMHLVLVAGSTGEDASRHGYRSVVESANFARDFLCALHFALPYEENDEEEPRGEGPLRRLKILVAEDNEINQMVIRKVLERAGHAVRLVADGRQALDALVDERFDVALLDLNMPVKSGLDVAREYHAATRENPTPLVALTADATVESKTTCRDAGMSAYITKPFEARKVLSTLDSVVPTVPECAGPPPEPPPMAAAVPADTPRNVALDEQTLRELEMIGPTSDFIKNLVWVFVRDGEKHVRAMDAALERRDIASFCNAAHALKGVAGSMGALKVMDLANDMQQMRENTPMSARYSRLAEVRDEICRVRRSLMRRYSVIDPATG